MRHPIILLAFVVAPLAAWSVAQEPAANPLAGKRFLSLEKLESGESPKGGIVLDYWHITFKDKSFTWRYSDILAEGTYSIDAKTGMLTVKEGDRNIEASFDAKTGVLTWDKRKYKAAKADK